MKKDKATKIKVAAKCRINATPKDVFNAWIDPAMISRWMFGSNVREEKIVKLQADARVGGKFSFVVERQGEVINHVGTYLEVQPYERLVFTWSVESESEDSIVTVLFVSQGKGCEVQLTHEMSPEWEAYKDRTQQAWQLMLDKMQEVFQSK